MNLVFYTFASYTDTITQKEVIPIKRFAKHPETLLIVFALIFACLCLLYTAYEKSQPYSKDVTHVSSDYFSEDDYESVIIDLNTADIYTLQRVPAIGDALSRKIVAYRERTGGFNSVLELKNIEGVTDSAFRKILPYVTVGDKTPQTNGTV